MIELPIPKMTFLDMRLAYALGRLVRRDIVAGNLQDAARRQRLCWNIMNGVTYASH